MKHLLLRAARSGCLGYLLFDLLAVALALLLFGHWGPAQAPDHAGLLYYTHCAAGLIPAGDGLTAGWACHN